MSRELVVHSVSSAPPEAWRELTAHQRLAKISGRSVFTRPIKDILRAFRLQIEALPTGTSKRGIILSGPDGVGKTALVREFAKTFPLIDPDGRDRRDVVLTVPTFKVDAASLADAVVREINWPVRAARQLGARSPEQQMDWVFEQAQTANPKLAGKFRYLELGPLSYGKRWLKAVAQYDAELQGPQTDVAL